jgi:hypothetical protein
MFAYVGGGYATLQEYMIFDEYVDLINPHLVIWQYCANDVINNSLELEQRSSINNNGLCRPYLTENHDVIDRIPKTLPLLRHLANEHSPFLSLIIYCLDRLAAPLSQTSLATWLSSETIEREIARQGLQHSEFQRAAHMTDEIMGMVRARRPDLPILAFSVDDEAPCFEAWQQIWLIVSFGAPGLDRPFSAWASEGQEETERCSPPSSCGQPTP